MGKKLAIALPGNELIIMPASVLKTLGNANENELRLLIWLYARGEFSAAEASRELGMTVSEAESAASFWKGAGLLTEETVKKIAAAPSESRVSYDASVIADACEHNAGFIAMCEELSETIGKMFNRTDYNTLFYLYDYCGLTGAFICTVAVYCQSLGKNDLRYLKNTVLSIIDEGIDNEKKLEAYLAAKERMHDSVNRLRMLCGMGERMLSAKENEFFRNWFEVWNIPFELIRLAYEKTVNATGKISFSYMNKILQSWHEEGFKTVEEVAVKTAKTGESDSFDADDFFVTALNNPGKDNA